MVREVQLIAKWEESKENLPAECDWAVIRERLCVEADLDIFSMSKTRQGMGILSLMLLMEESWWWMGIEVSDEEVKVRTWVMRGVENCAGQVKW
jgi:hypothetical protein